MKRFFVAIGLIMVVVMSLAFGALLVNGMSPTTAVAQTEPTEPTRTIYVSGNGRVSAQPDIAIVHLGVQTEADTAEDALNENNERMTAVISTTQELGIDEADIQTQGLSLQPVYDFSNTDGSSELTGYQASNMVQVTVRDLSQLGVLLDTAVEAGGNTIDSIQFEVSEREDLEAAAREAAMNDAQEKAEQLTSLAGASLGDVLSISESSMPGPMPLAFATDAAAESGVPISPGTQFIETNVQVSWEIR